MVKISPSPLVNVITLDETEAVIKVSSIDPVLIVIGKEEPSPLVNVNVLLSTDAVNNKEPVKFSGDIVDKSID